jgi:hypothetical protein
MKILGQYLTISFNKKHSKIGVIFADIMMPSLLALS